MLTWTSSSLSVSFLHQGQAAELDAVLQEGSDDFLIKQYDPSPLSAGPVPANKVWNAVYPLSAWTRCWLMLNLLPFQPGSAQPMPLQEFLPS